MLFIHPMWQSEVQRIGKRKCTPTGYALHVIADLTGFLGLLGLIGVGLYLAYLGCAGLFELPRLRLLTVPIAIGIVSELLFHVSWTLAYRKGFQYDYSSNRAKWSEAGQSYSYTLEEEIRRDDISG